MAQAYNFVYTSYRKITEVKQGMANLVLGWVTACQGDIIFLAASGHKFSNILALLDLFINFATKSLILTI